jgi:hypothetical protein
VETELIALIKKGKPKSLRNCTDEEWAAYWSDEEHSLFKAESWTWMYDREARARQCQKYSSWEEALLFLLFRHEAWKNASRARLLGALSMLRVEPCDASVTAAVKAYRLSQGGADWVFPMLRSEKSHTLNHRHYWLFKKE